MQLHNDQKIANVSYQFLLISKINVNKSIKKALSINRLNNRFSNETKHFEVGTKLRVTYQDIWSHTIIEVVVGIALVQYTTVKYIVCIRCVCSSTK